MTRPVSPKLALILSSVIVLGVVAAIAWVIQLDPPAPAEPIDQELSRDVFLPDA